MQILRGFLLFFQLIILLPLLKAAIFITERKHYVILVSVSQKYFMHYQLLGARFTEYERKDRITVHTEKMFLHENSIIIRSCNEYKLTDRCFAAGSFTYTNISLHEYFAMLNFS